MVMVHSVTRGWQDIGILFGVWDKRNLPYDALQRGVLSPLSKTYPRKPPAPPALTARQMAYSLLRRPAQRQLTQVQPADPLLATLVSHTETFAQMARERAADRLDSWVERVLASPWRELKRFAQGLRQDYAAVKAALTLRYSNGPTEGHVNRLKLFKRQMYGRAKLDLLRQRVLYAA